VGRTPKYESVQSERPFINRPNATIAVHIVASSMDMLKEISNYHEFSDENITFDTQLDVVLSAGITRTLTGVEERMINSHMWEHFFTSSGFHYSNATAKYPNKEDNKTVWNHVFAVFYNTDNWLSFEAASKEVDKLRTLKFSYSNIPVPPVVLLGIVRKGTPVVKAEDATVLASKYGIPFVESPIENKKFVNHDVYNAIIAARAPKEGNEKA